MTKKQDRHRNRPRPAVCLAIVLTVAAISLYCIGFYPSLNGGILGNILIWPAMILAGIAGILAIIGGRSGLHRKIPAIIVIVFGITLFFGSIIAGGFLIRDYFSFPMHSLSSDLSASSYTNTRIECQFGPVICTISDPHNAIWVRQGGVPSSVSVLSGVRVVRFIDQPVTLRTLRDAIHIGQDGIDIGGWMGAESDLITCSYTIDEWGAIQATTQAESGPRD